MWKQFLALALAVFLLSSSAQAWPWRFRHLQNQNTAAGANSEASASASGSGSTSANSNANAGASGSGSTGGTTNASSNANSNASGSNNMATASSGANSTTSSNGNSTTTIPPNENIVSSGNGNSVASSEGMNTDGSTNNISFDLSGSPPDTLPENDTSFSNFSQELDLFYSNFTNNSCVNESTCLNETDVLNWVNNNTMNCSLDNGTDCSWTNYTHSIQRSNCSDNTSIFCNETIISLSNVDNVTANWTWDVGLSTRNAFVLQNMSNVIINGLCANGTNCQNLFILNNVTDVTINITCWNSTTCDNIIAGNTTANVSEWIDCYDQATCGLNVWHQTWSNNSWQWANCSNLSTCSQINTGSNNTNITQVNIAGISSTCNDIVDFESTNNLTQNSSCDNSSICQITAVCSVSCSNTAQNFTCDDGAQCTNTTNITTFDQNDQSNSAPEGQTNQINVSPAVVVVPIVYDLNSSAVELLPENETSFGNFSQELDQFYANFSNNSCANNASCLDETPILDWVNTQSCTMDNGTDCSYTNYSYAVQRSNCSGNTSICNETIISISNVSDVIANWTWDLGLHARNAFVLQNISNVTINGECSNSSYCQNLFILNNVTDVTINITCWNNTTCDNIIAGNNTLNVSEWVICSDQATCGLNIWHQTWSTNSWQWANCSNSSTCSQINTGTNNTNITQINIAYSSSVSQDIVDFESTDILTQNSSCDNTSTCNFIAICEVACGSPAQNFTCDNGGTCTNTTNLIDAGAGGQNNTTPTSDIQANSTNSSASMALIVIPTVYNPSASAQGPLAENETSFGNFSQELDQFYANFSNNSCNSQVSCLDETPILDWVNTQNCTMEDGTSCSWSNYTHSVQRNDCSGNTSICNETIISISNVSNIIGNWTFNLGEHVRNAFVLQNVSNVTIRGECSNSSYCQNLFILNDVTNLVINITCSNNTVCDNIIAANSSANVTEWVDCHDQATCALNVWHQTWSNNSWQGANCSNQSVCGQINTGTNNTNVIQINFADDSSISQDIVGFESTDNLIQNSSCDNTSTCQIITLCELACTNPVQTITCDDGSVCTNITNLSPSGAAGQNESNQTNSASSTETNNTNSSAAASGVPIVYNVNSTAIAIVQENQTTFNNFSTQINQFYANFSNNSCNSQAGCLDESPILNWVNTQSCTIDNVTNCSWSNFTNSIARSNCSGNTSICNETIISISNVSDIISNWTWNNNAQARNAFVFQNASNITISTECSNGTHCQNLFILNNVTNITINITCRDNTTCDNIISANASSNVSEWVDCHNQATCGQNVFHQTWGNNSWQWTNCSNQSTCSDINTGTNNTNVTQVNVVNDSSVAQIVVLLESIDSLVQNNTVAPGCTLQNAFTCVVNCSNVFQSNDCSEGSTCSNAANFENNTSPSSGEQNNATPTNQSAGNSGNTNNNGGESGSSSGKVIHMSAGSRGNSCGSNNASGNRSGQGVLVSTNSNNNDPSVACNNTASSKGSTEGNSPASIGNIHITLNNSGSRRRRLRMLQRKMNAF